MALTLGSATFSGGLNLYGRPLFGPFDAPTVRAAFAGSQGEIELRDVGKGRQIIIPFRVGASSEANLLTALQTLSEWAGQKHGTLTLDGVEFPNVTFDGFDPRDRYRPVVSNGTLWLQHGTLRFRQLSTLDE